MSADHDLDPVVSRLRAYGEHPVDPALQSEHLTALASVRSGGSVFRSSLAGRLKVAAGVFAGFLIGATGLTTAGAMGPLQPIAADVVEAASPLDVPKGKSEEAKAKAAAKKAAKASGEGSAASQKIWAAQDGTCPAEGEFANRGQFLKAAKDGEDEAGMTFADARASDCGKAVAAAGGDDTEDDAKVTEAPETEGAENGKADDEHGKDTAPGQTGEKGNAEENKPVDPGKSADAPAGPPESAPADAAEENADDKAELPDVTPGEPEAKPEDA